MAAFALPGVAHATHAEGGSTTPAVVVADNPNCADVAPEGQTWFELKVEPPRNGTFPEGNLTVVISNLDGTYFDFTATPGVDAVIVKGGPDGNAYIYDPDSTGDTGLHSPINPNTGQPYGLSHISFCYDDRGALSGEKYHDLNGDGDRDEGEPGLGGFRFYADLNGNEAYDAGDEPIATSAEGSGAWTLGEMAPGTYTIRELPPAGQESAGWVCTEPATTCSITAVVPDDSDEVLRFGNWIPPRVQVIKNTVPTTDTTTVFGFSGTLPHGTNGSFTLTGHGSTTGFITTPAGTFTATENDPGPLGYTLTDITCTGTDTGGQSSDSGSTATFDVQSGDVVTCTFTNTKNTTTGGGGGGGTQGLPDQGVLPVAIESGAARLRGPRRCVNRPFTARVLGKRIKSVVWRVDGRRVARFSSKSGEATKVRFRVNPRRYGPGVHRLTARVRYNPAAQTAGKTMRMTFRLCARKAQAPQFTG